MRTLSARILLGFIALTIAFSVFAATIIVNLREVEDQASLILRRGARIYRLNLRPKPVDAAGSLLYKPRQMRRPLAALVFLCA